MATDSTHTKGGTRRRTFVALLLVALAGAAATAAVAAATGRPTAEATRAGYHWPIEPFDQPHPVRGAFGDPRTTFAGPPTPAALHGRGTFAYHFGVDIAAPDGTAVYAVRSGVARLRSKETVVVASGDGTAFEYWHIVPSVRDGQHVTAFETVLGRIRPGGYEHVHLTELRDGRPVNPLAPGHLTPYADATVPRVTRGVYLDRRGRELLPEFLSGRVQLAVEAADDTSMSVPGRWSGLPVTPARITWQIVRARTGTVVVPEREAFDVRERLPRAPFWATYIRGTRQNMANFAGHKMWRQPGVYRFRLDASFDTRRLKDDIYELVVTASDTGGNAGTGRFVFTIHNKRGFFDD